MTDLNHLFSGRPAGGPPPADDGRTTSPAASATSRRDNALTGLAVALLITAVGLSTFYSRAESDLDWSNYVVGLAATIALLAVAVVARIVLADRDTNSILVSWPGAFGAVAVGLMAAVALDDSSATAYVAGVLVAALSVAGYLAVRAAPFVVTAIGGLFVLYGQLIDDLFDVVDLGDGDNGVILAAFILVVFTVLVTAAGWLLPATRVLSGVIAGLVSIVGFVALMAFVGIAAAFASFDFNESGPVGRDTTFDNDVWVVLVLALLLVLAWTVCAYLTGHVAFRLLAVGMATSVVPAATVVLAVDHPTWWAVLIGVPGGLILLAVLGLRFSGGRRQGPSSTQPPTQPMALPPSS